LAFGVRLEGSKAVPARQSQFNLFANYKKIRSDREIKMIRNAKSQTLGFGIVRDMDPKYQIYFCCLAQSIF